jgi:hypothetical protein
MAQAELVRQALAETSRAVTIVVIETEGDRRAPDTAWGEGAFVAAIERALLDQRVDIAVHSAKDIPTDEDPRLSVAAYLPRADARDALVVREGTAFTTLDHLPPGSRVGTDSPRRTGFVRARRPATGPRVGGEPSGLMDVPLRNPAPGMFEDVFFRARPAGFWLDARALPADTAGKWLHGPRPMRLITELYAPEAADAFRTPIELPTNYDAVLFIKHVTAAKQ